MTFRLRKVTKLKTKGDKQHKVEYLIMNIMFFVLFCEKKCPKKGCLFRQKENMVGA